MHYPDKFLIPKGIPNLLSLVFPVYNEEAMIPHLRKAVSEYIDSLPVPCEVILVNDGSRDNSLTALIEWSKADDRITVLALARNFGHQAAASAGLVEAKGDAIILLDADLQDPLCVVTEMLEEYKKGYDVVYGQRTTRHGESFFKKATAWAYYRSFKIFGNLDLPVDTGDFRLISRRCLQSVNSMTENPRFLRGLVTWVGFPQVAVQYERNARTAGETKYPLRKMLKFAIDGIISFSEKPLKLITTLGIIVVLLSIIIAIYSIIQHYFLNNTVPGWTSLTILMIFFNGSTLFSIGLIGEYLGRIYNQSKNRPLYIVADKYNNSKKHYSCRITQR